MRIIGVDPGSTTTGYAVIEVKGDHIHVLTMGIIRLSKSPDHQRKLREIFLRVQTVIEQYGPQKMAIEAIFWGPYCSITVCTQYGPQKMAIEAPFYGKNPQSMLKLGRVQGVAIAAASAMALEVEECSPKRIKQPITGNGNSSQEKVAGTLELGLA